MMWEGTISMRFYSSCFWGSRFLSGSGIPALGFNCYGCASRGRLLQKVSRLAIFSPMSGLRGREQIMIGFLQEVVATAVGSHGSTVE